MSPIEPVDHLHRGHSCARPHAGRNALRVGASLLALTIAGATAPTLGQPGTPDRNTASHDASRQDAANARVIDRHLDAACGLLERGESELSIPEFRAALEAGAVGEDRAIARYGLALALSRLARFDDVARTLDGITDERPTPPDDAWRTETLVLFADASLRTDRLDRAVSALDTALRRTKDEALTVALLGSLVEAHARRDDLDACLAASDRLAAIETTAARPIAARASIRAAELALASKRSAAVVARVTPIVAAIDDGALRLDEPTSARARAVLARALERSGRLDDAAVLYARLSSGSTPRACGAALDLASLQLRRDRAREARAALARFERCEADADVDQRERALHLRTHVAIRLDDERTLRALLPRLAEPVSTDETAGTGTPKPDGRRAWWCGRAQLHLDDVASAIDSFSRARREAPGGPIDASATFDLAVALARLDRHADVVAIVEEFDRAHHEHALAPDAQRLAAAAELSLDRARDCRERCARALRRFTDDPRTLEFRLLDARALESLGRTDEAIDAWREVLAASGSDARTNEWKRRLGLLLHAAGRAAEATVLLDAIPTHRDAEPDVLIARADLAIAANDPAKALTLLDPIDLATLPAAVRADVGLLRVHAARRAGEHARAIGEARALLTDAELPAERAPRIELERALSLRALDRNEQALASLAATIERLDRLDAGALDQGAEVALRRNALAERATLLEQRGRDRDAVVALDELAPLLEREVDRRDVRLRAASLLAVLGEDESAFERLSALAAEEDDATRRAEVTARAALSAARIAGAATDDADAVRVALQWIDRAFAASDDAAGFADGLARERAVLLEHAGRPGEAAVAWRSYLDLAIDPLGIVRARLALADLARSTDRPADVVELLLPARDTLASLEAADDARIAVDPALAAALAQRLGLALAALDRHREAAPELERAASLTTDPRIACAAAASAAESWLRAGDPERAATQFERVVREDPDEARRDDALLRLAECRAAQGRWRQAETLNARYLERHPDDARWYVAAFGEARAIERQGRLEVAADRYRALAERHDGPTAARAQFQLGECLFALERHEDALRELLKVEILFDAPLWAAAALHEAASCQEALARPTDARVTLERLVREHPDSEWAARARTRLERLVTTDTEATP